MSVQLKYPTGTGEMRESRCLRLWLYRDPGEVGKDHRAVPLPSRLRGAPALMLQSLLDKYDVW